MLQTTRPPLSHSTLPYRQVLVGTKYYLMVLFGSLLSGCTLAIFIREFYTELVVEQNN